MLKKKYIPITIIKMLAEVIPPPIVFYKKTFDSCPCASDSAHRRKYEAVFEILPKMNSIV